MAAPTLHHEIDPTRPVDPANSHAELASRLTRLMHSMGRFKHQVQATRRESETAYNMILFHLVHSGPVRAGVLAEYLDADPSTVSRQVSALVKDGLIERQADPEDGRASLLAATDAGQERFGQQVARRTVHFERMLTDWEDDEIAVFAGHLTRFTNAFEAYKPELLAELEDEAPRPSVSAAASREEN